MGARRLAAGFSPAATTKHNWLNTVPLDVSEDCLMFAGSKNRIWCPLVQKSRQPKVCTQKSLHQNFINYRVLSGASKGGKDPTHDMTPYDVLQPWGWSFSQKRTPSGRQSLRWHPTSQPTHLPAAGCAPAAATLTAAYCDPQLAFSAFINASACASPCPSGRHTPVRACDTGELSTDD